MLSARTLRLSVAMFSTFIGVPWPASLAAAEWRPMRMRVNGIELDVQTTESSLSREEIAQQLLATWSVQGALRPTHLVLTDRTVIGRQRGAIHESVSLRPIGRSGRTQIEYAAQDLTATRNAVARPPFTPPAGLRTLQVLEYIDDPRGARQFAMQMRRSPQVTMAAVRGALRRSAWSVQTRAIGVAPANSVPTDRGFVLFAERAGERAELTVRAEHDGTRVLMVVRGRAQ